MWNEIGMLRQLRQLRMGLYEEVCSVGHLGLDWGGFYSLDVLWEAYRGSLQRRL